MTEDEIVALKKSAKHYSKVDGRLKARAISLLNQLNTAIPMPVVLYQDLKATCSKDRFRECLALELAIYYLEYKRVGEDENLIPQTYRTNLEEAGELFVPILTMYDLEHPVIDKTGRFYWFKADSETIEILNTIINV